jgi:hypothetical protein
MITTTIELAREVKMPYDFVTGEPINIEKLEAFEALVRADERALAAPVQEPVAWAIYQQGRLQSFWLDKGDAYDFEFTSEHEWKPLYTTPPAAQRQWVGLTPDDIRQLEKENTVGGLHGDYCPTWDLIESVEAKLKEKNT